MKYSTKVKMDLSGLKKLRSELRLTTIEVGWLDNVEHWSRTINVPSLAATLHYDSPWADRFMLDDSKVLQVSKIVKQQLNYFFGCVPLVKLANNIGEELTNQIRVNIIDVSAPANSDEWAQEKGFNDPLIYGSAYGEEPNLLSALSWKVYT